MLDRPGFRRRILIKPKPGFVAAELEDDWHRMVVSLCHSQGLIIAVESEMIRWPWTTCPGARAVLSETFTGVALDAAAKRGERFLNCTHLHDLALFAAAHAGGGEVVAYDVMVSDAVAGKREAVLALNGVSRMVWRLEGDLLVGPADLAGLRLGDLGDWIAGLDAASKEAARILRWAAILATGRAMDIPAGLSATAFPSGSCFTFQAETAREALRLADAHTDFSGRTDAPLKDCFPAF